MLTAPFSVRVCADGNPATYTYLYLKRKKMKSFKQFLDEGLLKTASNVIFHPIKTLINKPIQKYAKKLDARDKKLDNEIDGPKLTNII